MTSTLESEDLTRMSELLALEHSAPLDEVGLPNAMLLGLAELVRCDLVSFLDLDVAHTAPDIDQESDGRLVTTARTVSDGTEPFWQHYWTTACCSYPTRTGDDRSVTMLSDFYSQREWQATPMYTDAFADNRFQHELMCCLPTMGTRSRRVVFFRLGGSDFTERDRMVMALLRPHLAELHARVRSSAIAEATSGALTPRQTELLRLVAAGRSTTQIAETLFLSPATVRKHIENIFDRLGVTNRTAAVMSAFTMEALAAREL
ncbi:response regulator transcription factor [Aeromicrobium sp.]|uniref:response regulator transcription factor n=1 Tax=Aeromicrobium sp. TaxID=1871063 RepID=UPI003C688C03